MMNHSTRLMIAFAGLLIAVSQVSTADAQYYRGFRPRGAVVIAPPIMPSRYWGTPWPAAPIMIGPPSSVRVLTPFFSMNLGADVFVPQPYGVSPYLYESYRPRFDDRYQDDRYQDDRYQDDRYQDDRYQPGIAGGIPDVTANESFSPSALRSGARALAATLNARPQDGDVWLDYLQPERIIAALDSGELTPLVKVLHDRFVGVTMNPELDAVTRISGFDETLHQLGLWMELDNRFDVPQVSPSEIPTSETLPAEPVRHEPLPAPIGTPAL